MVMQKILQEKVNNYMIYPHNKGILSIVSLIFELY